MIALITGGVIMLGSEVFADTFGETGVGSSNPGQNLGHPHCGQFTAPASGTLTSMSVYTNDDDVVGGPMQMAIYDDDNSDALVDTTTASSPAAGYEGWTTQNFSGTPTITSGTNYLLCAWASDFAHKMAYDSSGGTERDLESSGYSYNSWPDPIAAGTAGTRLYSIYATYTPEAGAAEVPLGFWGDF